MASLVSKIFNNPKSETRINNGIYGKEAVVDISAKNKNLLARNECRQVTVERSDLIGRSIKAYVVSYCSSGQSKVRTYFIERKFKVIALCSLAAKAANKSWLLKKDIASSCSGT